MSGVCNFSVLVIVLVFLGDQKVLGQRRDANWPPPSVVAYLKQPHEVCIGKTGTTEEAIKAYSDTDATADDKLRCYMACLFQECNVVDDEGHLHLDKLMAGVEAALSKEVQDIAMNMGKRCLRAEGKTPCETAGWYNDCWKKSDPTHYFLV